jgi:lysozyme
MRRWPTSLLILAVGACGCVDPDLIGERAGAVHTVCGGSATVKGIDVSKWQGTVTWSSVKSDGKVFAFARVNHGLADVDGQFPTNWSAMKKAGVIRGPYQYFLPNESALDQAKLFVQKIAAAGGLLDGDLPPVLDLEETGGKTAAEIVTAVDVWMKHVEAQTARRPILYTGSYFWDDHKLGAKYSTVPLWTAHYNVTCPLIPNAWSAWTFWQHSSSGVVKGITPKVDLDVFNGTAAQLDAFIKASKISSPVDAGPDGRSDGSAWNDAMVSGDRSVDREARDGAAVVVDGGLSDDDLHPAGGCSCHVSRARTSTLPLGLLLALVVRRCRR